MDGSNTRPRAVFTLASEVPEFAKRLDGQNVYFEGLYNVGNMSDHFANIHKAFNGARPGSIVWNANIDKDKIYVKCKDNTWIYFTEIVLPGLGRLNATQLITKVFKTQISKPVLPSHSQADT